MKQYKLRLWLVLILAGMTGVASLLASDLPLSKLPKEVTEVFSPAQLRLLILVNPALLLLIAITVGTLVHDKVLLRVPLLERLLGRPDRQPFSLQGILVQGMLLGVLAGALIVGITQLFTPHLPGTLISATSDMDLNLVTRLLYGGISEELLTRFGLMSLFAWALFRLTKRRHAPVYWTAIVLAALPFAIGHLPVVFQLVPDPTPAVYAYIILGNSIGGILFGYAYWKKGLESACLAHAVTHLTMIGIHFLLF